MKLRDILLVFAAGAALLSLGACMHNSDDDSSFKNYLLLQYAQQSDNMGKLKCAYRMKRDSQYTAYTLQIFESLPTNSKTNNWQIIRIDEGITTNIASGTWAKADSPDNIINLTCSWVNDTVFPGATTGTFSQSGVDISAKKFIWAYPGGDEMICEKL